MKREHGSVLIAICLCAPTSFAQLPSGNQKAESLCILQKNVVQGKHRTVHISGLYGPGLNHTVLEAPSCSAEGTWAELDLHSGRNKERLRKLLDKSRRAFVVVEGEFYGPPLPDPNLPEAIRKNFYPGWGHLAAFKTKIVVHAIVEVKPLPTSSSGSGLDWSPLPRINQLYAASFEVVGVARRDDCIFGAGNRGDLRVEFRHRSALLSPRRCD